MASEWYYKSDNGRVGPYSSSQIHDLLKAGTITTATLLRKQGMPDWVPIGQIPNLAEPDTSASDTLPPEESKAASPTMIQEAKAAARATALAAEKKRIELINLPAAYRQLGRQCFEERRWATDFPEAYRELDSLHEQSAQSQKRSAEIPPGTTMPEKAKSLASKGVEYAKSQQISAQIQTALANLGKEAYAKHRNKAGTDSVTSPVTTLETRLDQIGKEQGTSSVAAGRYKWLKRFAAAMALLVVLGWIVGPSDDDASPEDSGSANESQANESSANASQTSPTFSGTKKEYWPNGKLKLQQPYRNGLEHGTHKAWHENGTLSYDMPYTNGKVNGRINKWWDNGKKRFSGAYKNGLAYGEHTSWHDNGRKSSVVTFKDGKPHGPHKEWDSEDGTLIKHDIYKNGDNVQTKYYQNYYHGVVIGLHHRRLVQKFPENARIQMEARAAAHAYDELIDGCLQGARRKESAKERDRLKQQAEDYQGFVDGIRSELGSI
jgi:hypothetical protein